MHNLVQENEWHKDWVQERIRESIIQLVQRRVHCELEQEKKYKSPDKNHVKTQNAVRSNLHPNGYYMSRMNVAKKAILTKHFNGKK